VSRRVEHALQNPLSVAPPYLEARYRPTHHFRNFTLVVLLAVLTFLVALALAAHYAPR